MAGAHGGVGIERLFEQEPASWILNLYPGAGEAGGCFVPSLRRRGGGGAPGVPAADPLRAAQEAGRRARGRLRRYGVIPFLWTGELGC